MSIIQTIGTGILALGVAIAGFFGFVPQDKITILEERVVQLETAEDINLGAYYPVAGKTYYLSGSGIGTTDTSIILVSFQQPVSNTELTMTDFGAIGYATIDPGTSKKEFVSFTGVTQDGSSNKATLTGVSRGLQFVYPYTSSSSLASSHSGGAKLIISNPPQHYEQYANLSRTQTISGVWTFGSSTIPRYDATITTSAFTSDAMIPDINFVRSVATSGASQASYSIPGLSELATGTEIMSGVATSGASTYLVIPSELAHSSSTARYMIPITRITGKLDQGFLDLTEKWSFSKISSASSTFTGNTTIASTTITALEVTGTTTFTMLPHSSVTPTSGEDLTTKTYVDLKYKLYALYATTSDYLINVGTGTASNCTSTNDNATSTGIAEVVVGQWCKVNFTTPRIVQRYKYGGHPCATGDGRWRLDGIINYLGATTTLASAIPMTLTGNLTNYATFTEQILYGYYIQSTTKDTTCSNNYYTEWVVDYD